jgi:small-conductance mechanosensitive channel
MPDSLLLQALPPVASQVDELMARFLTFLPQLISALVIFVASLYLAGFASRWIKQTLTVRKRSPEITLLLSKLTRWSTVVLGATIALETIGFNLTAFLAGLGILGFTVGFALQDVSKNFVAGILLLLQQPFEIGQIIEVGKFSGTVVSVNLRATELRTVDGRQVLIPNADVFTSALVNLSRYPERRIEYRLGLAYDCDLESARQAALGGIQQVAGVLAEPAPRVIFNAFSPVSIELWVYFWIDTNQTDLLSAQDAGILGVQQAFQEAGIELNPPGQFLPPGLGRNAPPTNPG